SYAFSRERIRPPAEESEEWGVRRKAVFLLTPRSSLDGCRNCLGCFSLAQPFRAGDSGGARGFFRALALCWGGRGSRAKALTEGLKPPPAISDAPRFPALKGWANETTHPKPLPHPTRS